MDPLDLLLSERKKRKSISEAEYNRASRDVYKIGPHYENIRQNYLHQYNKQVLNGPRQTKKSIIKINKKKLPLDFFMNDTTQGIIKKTLDMRERQKKDSAYNILANEKKICSERFIEYQSAPEDYRNSSGNQFMQTGEDKFKNTCFFGNSESKPKNIAKKDLDKITTTEKPTYRRNYETRSEQKRQKIQIQQRKFTAANYSQKQDILQILPAYKQKLDSQINDMIIFTGVLTKELKQIGRTSPIKQMLTPIKERIERRNNIDSKEKYLDLKINSNLKQKSNFQKELDSPIKSERQIYSPTRFLKQYSTPLKEVSSPVKIMPTNPENGSSLNSSEVKMNFKKSLQYDINSPMNITFFNAKSTILPPISQNNFK